MKLLLINFSYELILATVYFTTTVSHLFNKIARPCETAIFTRFSLAYPSWEKIFQLIFSQPAYLESLFIMCITQFIFSKCFLAFQFPTKISNAFLSFLVRFIWFKYRTYSVNVSEQSCILTGKIELNSTTKHSRCANITVIHAIRQIPQHPVN
jgi:hypothetical protein